VPILFGPGIEFLISTAHT
jgi:hypothetical protein